MTTPKPERAVRERLSPSGRSAASQPHRHRSLHLGLATALLLWGGLLLADVAAAATLTLDSASWNSRDSVLKVSGGGASRRVTLVNAYNPSQILGTDKPEDDGRWSVKKSRPSPVPCRVRVTQPNGQTAERNVSNAPASCSPKAPDTNIAPTANANGPYSGTIGAAITFSSAGSTDPDGSIAGYAWTFGDGATGTTANPTHAYTAAGTYTVTLKVTDNLGAASAIASTTATVVANNVAPTANANGPYSGTIGTAITFSSAGSTDPDGSIAGYAWTFGDGATGTTANPTHVYTSAGTFTVSLIVTDNQGTSSAAATTTATIPDTVACKSPIAEHCNITAYTGPAVCVACHEDQARDMHSSVHYQQGGAFPNATNIPSYFAAAGERPAKAAGDLVATGVNTYCGTHENSPRFTCAGCHVGNGRFPLAQSVFETLPPNDQRVELANIDCLMCHQEVYKRFPDWTLTTGLGFSDFKLLNLALDANGHLIPSLSTDPASPDYVLRTGFQGIPNVDTVTRDFQFMPAGIESLPTSVPMTPMPITTLEAAQTAHATTRQSCLNCHAGAAGADGAKRGDLSKENVNPTLKVDVHMSPAGVDLTCSDCHNAILDDGTTHRVRGRGLDLRANDIVGANGVADRFTCDSGGCHTSTPHGDYSATSGSSRDKHATKVACQTCHIPAYAKAAVGTEIARDWQDPHPADAACNGRGGWLPREDKGGLGSASLIPSYTWFDGTSEVAYLDESLAEVQTFPLDASVAQKFVGGYAAGEPAYALGMPNGDASSDSAKIYPMKKHWGKLARNDATDTLVGHSTFEFFRTGSFCRAVAVGLGLDQENTDTSTVCDGTPGSLEMPPGTTTVPVFTYQTINHGVEPKANALGSSTTGCGTCHKALTPGTPRMDMAGLGYGPRTDPSVVIGTLRPTLNGNLDNICSQCHSNKTEKRDFRSVHDKHVSDKKKDCAACHNFSRPERSLSLSRR